MTVLPSGPSRKATVERFELRAWAIRSLIASGSRSGRGRLLRPAGARRSRRNVNTVSAANTCGRADCEHVVAFALVEPVAEARCCRRRPGRRAPAPGGISQPGRPLDHSTPSSGLVSNSTSRGSSPSRAAPVRTPLLGQIQRPPQAAPCRACRPRAPTPRSGSSRSSRACPSTDASPPGSACRPSGTPCRPTPTPPPQARSTPVRHTPALPAPDPTANRPQTAASTRTARASSPGRNSVGCRLLRPPCSISPRTYSPAFSR